MNLHDITPKTTTPTNVLYAIYKWTLTYKFAYPLRLFAKTQHLQYKDAFEQVWVTINPDEIDSWAYAGKVSWRRKFGRTPIALNFFPSFLPTIEILP